MTEQLKECAGECRQLDEVFDKVTMTSLRLSVVERTSNAFPVMQADINTLFQELADLAHHVQSIGERLTDLEAHVDSLEDDQK